MAFLNLKELKSQASARVAASRTDKRTLVLVYCGVIAALSLGSNGLQLFLDSQISNTGGLSGLELRSVLQTFQSILSYVNMFFGPFWQAGFLFAMIGIARGQDPGPKSLAEGFRRFPRILSYTLWLMLIIFFAAMAATYAASLVFTFSPWGADFAEIMEPVLMDPNLFTSDGSINMDLVPMEAMAVAVPPMAVMMVLIFVPLYAFISYTLRLSTYLMMEGGRVSAMRAMATSARLMKGHRWQLFKLDLSFWWYTALILFATAVGYLDVILSLAGISVPIDSNVMFFGTLVLYCILDLLICLWKKCDVETTYVLAFEAIVNAQAPAPAPAYPGTGGNPTPPYPGSK